VRIIAPRDAGQRGFRPGARLPRWAHDLLLTPRNPRRRLPGDGDADVSSVALSSAPQEQSGLAAADRVAQRAAEVAVAAEA